MDTTRFRTKTEIRERDNGHLDNIWEIAMDIGYSSVKLFSPNIVASFPSYARKVESDFKFAGEAPKNSILYRDDTSGQMWLVGQVAQDTIAYGDTTDSESALYSRERYNSDMFLVIARAGLGLAMQSNRFGSPDGKPVFLQTGLPEKYMRDTKEITEALSGMHKFSLLLGSGVWKHYTVDLSPSSIAVLSQPRGTLFSVCTDRNGHFRSDARDYLQSSVIIFDAGFGTLDLFPITSGAVGHGETYPDLGMRQVLSETSELIRDKYDTDIPVPSMQKYLETGNVIYFDRKNFKSREYPFDALLQQACEHVCNEAVTRMANALPLIDYRKIVVTGGTGEAWYDMIKNKLVDLPTLSVVPGNMNDDLPFIYANVRGYYYYRFNKLAAQEK